MLDLRGSDLDDTASRPLRFHWSLSSAGDTLRGARARSAQGGLPSFAAHLEFCRRAEEAGIESLLVAFGFHRADPIALASALGVMTEKIKFLVACRSGIFSPTYFVQQVNTVSALTAGRIAVNVVAGHTPHEHGYYGDFLDHDERYDRADEFWSICQALWRGDGEVSFSGKHYRIEKARLNTSFVAPDRTAPEIYVGGGSERAERLAAKHASCLLRLPVPPERLGESIRPLLAQGTEVGLLVSMIARPTRQEAVDAARSLVAGLAEESREVHRRFALASDSVAFKSTYDLAANSPEWLTPCLWTGAVPYLGAPAIALVGSPDDLTAAILEYQSVGVSQFLFMGWPDLETMTYFGREVLPLVRARQARQGDAAQFSQGGCGRAGSA
jgi:alkanesulfonate monooxygenase